MQKKNWKKDITNLCIDMKGFTHKTDGFLIIDCGYLWIFFFFFANQSLALHMLQ